MSIILPRLSAAVLRIPARKRRPLTRPEFDRRVRRVTLEALAATCLWDREEPPLGDYRAAVFSAGLARDGGASIHLWSFPHLPVLIEVSWTSEHPTSRWPPSDVAARLERLGFRAGGRQDQHEREVRVATPRDVERTARLVLDVFYDVFDYRGTVPLDIQTVYDGRASQEFVYNSFSADEIAWLATRLGCRARIQPADVDGSRRAIALSKGAVTAEIVLADSVDAHQYASGFLGSPAVSSARHAARRALRHERPGLKPDVWRVGVTLHFDGGVTAEWVAGRIEYGMALAAGRPPRPGPFLDLAERSRPPRQLPHIYSAEQIAAATSSTVAEVEAAGRRYLRSLWRS